MNNVILSFFEALRIRATTAIVGTYTLFFLVFHWQGIYTTIFTSEDYIYEKFGLLKNEYVNIYFFGFYPWYLPVLHYVAPAILTWLFIWILPKHLFIHAFKKEREYKYDQRVIVYDNDIKLEGYKAKFARVSQEAIKEEKKVIEETKKLEVLDPNIKWKREYYELIKNLKFTESINNMIDAIYNHAGHIGEYYSDRYGWRKPSITSENLAIVDSNGLLNINANKIATLTDKGKFFVNMYYSSKFN